MSDRIIEAVEEKSWCLYDVSGDLQLETWEERGEREPTDQILEGNMYLFVPKPAEDQTLRDAYAVTMGVGPCLRMGDPNSKEYKALALRFTPRLAVFTRLILESSELVLFTPPTAQLPESDLVVLPRSTAEDTFVQGFDVITPEGFQRELTYAQAEFRT